MKVGAEIRRAFGPGMVTALGRIEGKSFGIVATIPFIWPAPSTPRLGQGRALPAIVATPSTAGAVPVRHAGMMGGAEVEKTALVRHCSRLFVTGANLSVRSHHRAAQGLRAGAQAMAGGSFHAGTSPSPGRRASSVAWAGGA